MALVNIPRLDLTHYTEGNSELRKHFVADIGKAFNETGFVTISNHGLSQELIDELYQKQTDNPLIIRVPTLKQ